MAAISHVVKLEEIADDQQSTTSEDLGALVDSSRNASSASHARHSSKNALTKSSRSSRTRGEERDSARTGDESRLSDTAALVEYLPNEARDLLRPYPEGWPKLPAVLQARDYTTSQAPAVNLASAHLELLQNVVEDWFRAMTSSGSRPMSALVSARDFGAAGTRRHLRFDVAPEVEDLALVGIGGKAGYGTELSPPASADVPDTHDLPYLGAEHVIEEVMNLLAKLENDRREIITDYKSQREKVKRLSARIDALAERRLDMMPAAVQNEHEACARDIYELQWHISYRGRIRDRTTTRREAAEDLYDKLQKEIAYLLEQSPLVKEKLDMEIAVMDNIHKAQEETSAELKLTVDKCEKLQAKSDDTHTRAEQERQYMKDELISLNKDLEKISAELERVRQQHEKFLEKIDGTKSNIAQVEEDIETMKVRNADAQKEQEDAKARVKTKKTEIYKHEQEQRSLVEEMIKKQKKVDTRKKAQASVEAKLQKNVDQLEDEYQFVHRIAQAFDLDIEDFQRKCEECEKQRAANEKRIESLKRSVQSTGEELQTIMQDFNNADTVNKALTSQLRAEEAKAKKVEEQLKMALAGLKKQVQDEKNARAMLESNIASDKEELEKAAVEGEVKKGKLEVLAAELQKAVNEILVKVEALRATRAEKDEKLANLRSDLDQVRQEHERVNAELTACKQRLQPREKTLQDDILGLDKKIDHLDWRSEMMQKKMDDMAASAHMMTRAVNNTEKDIKLLTEQLEDVTLRHEAAQKSLAGLKDLLGDTTARNRQYDDDHTQLMRERDTVLKQHVADLEQNHKSNTQLASQYRRLDNECMLLKDKHLNEMEEALQLENTLKDIRQLRSLQTKMHSALSEYFKHRGLYMKSELDCMEGESYANCRKVHSLHADINSAMEVTAEFLVNSMDHTKARKMAEEAIRKEEESLSAAS